MRRTGENHAIDGGAAAAALVLVLNYGGWDDTIALTDALMAQGLVPWVIDNGSPVDRSPELLRRHPGVRYLPLGHNWGWAGGYNRAIAAVRAECGWAERVYILNNDASPEPGAIAAALGRLRADSGVAAVGSVMLTGDGAAVLFDGNYPDPPYPVASIPAGGATGGNATRQIHGGGFALDLAAYDAIGPFDERYFLYHEETQWCLRAGAAGWRLLVDPASRVRHDGAAADTGGNRAYYLTRNRYLALADGWVLDPALASRAALLAADAGRVAHDPQQRIAIVHGMADGLAGRTGQRPPCTWTQAEADMRLAAMPTT